MFLTPWIRTVKNRLSWTPWLRRHRRAQQSKRPPMMLQRDFARRLSTEAEALEDKTLLAVTLAFGNGTSGQNMTLTSDGASDLIIVTMNGANLEIQLAPGNTFTAASTDPAGILSYNNGADTASRIAIIAGVGGGNRLGALTANLGGGNDTFRIDTNRDLGNVDIDGEGGIDTVSLADSAAFSLSTVANRSLTVTAENISQNNALTVGLGASFNVGTGRDFSLINPGNDFRSTVTVTSRDVKLFDINDIEVTGTIAGEINVNTPNGDADITDSDTLELGDAANAPGGQTFFVGGSLQADATNGQISSDDTDRITVVGDISLTADGTGGGINLENLAVGGGFFLDTTGNAVIVNNADTATNVALVGDIQFGVSNTNFGIGNTNIVGDNIDLDVNGSLVASADRNITDNGFRPGNPNNRRLDFEGTGFFEAGDGGNPGNITLDFLLPVPTQNYAFAAQQGTVQVNTRAAGITLGDVTVNNVQGVANGRNRSTAATTFTVFTTFSTTTPVGGPINVVDSSPGDNVATIQAQNIRLIANEGSNNDDINIGAGAELEVNGVSAQGQRQIILDVGDTLTVDPNAEFDDGYIGVANGGRYVIRLDTSALRENGAPFPNTGTPSDAAGGTATIAGDMSTGQILVQGGSGADTIDISGITRPVVGGTFAEDFEANDAFSATLLGHEGNDTITGSDFDDSIEGNRGDDVLTGGDGDDLFVWRQSVAITGTTNDDGNDIVDGGAERDTGDLNPGESGRYSTQVVSPTVQSGGGGRVFSADDTLVDDRFGDQLQVRYNDLNAGNPSNSVAGLGENITVTGNAGGFVINRAVDSFGGASYLASTLTTTGVEHVTLEGGGGDDRIEFNDLSNAGLVSFDVYGDDIAGTQSGADFIDARNINLLTTNIEAGQNVNNVMRGVTLRGGGADDTLIGGNGNDVLEGDEGNDIITGGEGSDLLIEQGRSEILTGSAAFSDVITGNLNTGPGNIAATVATTFNNITPVAGGAFVDGDQLDISGIDAVGNAVLATFTIDHVASVTLGDLLSFIEANITGNDFSAGGGVTTSITGTGVIRVRTNIGVDSAINVTLNIASNAGNTGNTNAAPLGVFNTTQQGQPADLHLTNTRLFSNTMGTDNFVAIEYVSLTGSTGADQLTALDLSSGDRELNSVIRNANTGLGFYEPWEANSNYPDSPGGDQLAPDLVNAFSDDIVSGGLVQNSLAQVSLVGAEGNDVFDVAPGFDIKLDVFGGAPNGAVGSPGDVMNLDVLQVVNPVISDADPGPGIIRPVTGTVTSDSHGTLDWSSIENVSDNFGAVAQTLTTNANGPVRIVRSEFITATTLLVDLIPVNGNNFLAGDMIDYTIAGEGNTFTRNLGAGFAVGAGTTVQNLIDQIVLDAGGVGLQITGAVNAGRIEFTAVNAGDNDPNELTLTLSTNAQAGNTGSSDAAPLGTFSVSTQGAAGVPEVLTADSVVTTDTLAGPGDRITAKGPLVNGTQVFAANAVSQFNVLDGGTFDNELIVDHSNGLMFQTFNFQAGGNSAVGRDNLTVIGDTGAGGNGISDTRYLPGTAGDGSGRITVDGRTILFSGLTPDGDSRTTATTEFIRFANNLGFTFTTPNSHDDVDVLRDRPTVAVPTDTAISAAVTGMYTSGFSDTSLNTVTTSTLLRDLTGINGTTFDIGDVINITGVNVAQANINTTFTITAGTADTLGQLLTAISTAFVDATATFNASTGQINLTANAVGDVQPVDLALRLSSAGGNSGNLHPNPFGEFRISRQGTAAQTEQVAGAAVLNAGVRRFTPFLVSTSDNVTYLIDENDSLDPGDNVELHDATETSATGSAITANTDLENLTFVLGNGNDRFFTSEDSYVMPVTGASSPGASRFVVSGGSATDVIAAKNNAARMVIRDTLDDTSTDMQASGLDLEFLNLDGTTTLDQLSGYDFSDSAGELNIQNTIFLEDYSGGIAELTGDVGNNIFDLDGWLGSGAQAVIDGAGGNDALVAANFENNWNITADNEGDVGEFSFTDTETLIGNTRSDRFNFDDQTGVSSLFGDNGTDSVDFADYNNPIAVRITINTTSYGGNITADTMNPTLNFNDVEGFIGSNASEDFFKGFDGQANWTIDAGSSAGNLTNEYDADTN